MQAVRHLGGEKSLGDERNECGIGGGTFGLAPDSGTFGRVLYLCDSRQVLARIANYSYSAPDVPRLGEQVGDGGDAAG